MYGRVKILVIMFLALFLSTATAQDAWVAKDGAIKNSELRDVVFSRDAAYVATKNAVYKVKDMKERWEPVFSIPSGGNNEITCLAGRPKAMFAGTKRGSSGPMISARHGRMSLRPFYPIRTA